VRDLLPFVIAGVASGAIYGLTGAGLVLTYKTSGIFNFGQGAIGTFTAYVFYWLNVTMHLDWKICFFLCVCVLGPLLGLLMDRMGSRLATQRSVYKIVGTVSLIVIVQAAGTLKYGTLTLPFPQYLPKGQDTFRLAGVNVGFAQLTVTIVAVLAVAGLYLLFRFTRVGLAMRAVVDDADLLDLVGTDPVRQRRTGWIIGSVFASLSGVLILPLIGLDPLLLTMLAFTAFGAAAIGAFSSIPLTLVGGIAIGIGIDLCTKWFGNVSWATGVPSSLSFAILVIVLLLLPRRKLSGRAGVERRPQRQYKAPPAFRLLMGGLVIVLLALVPSVVGDVNLIFFSSALTVMIVVLSLGLLVRTSGQVSLCQTSFMAIGAVAFSQFIVGHGLPWLIALVLGGLVALALGVLVALPAIRLSGIFLALATFGFAIMMQQLFYPLNIMFTSLNQGRVMPRPSFAASDKSFYYLILAFVVLTAFAIVLIHEGRLGRLLKGMSDSSLAVSSMGLNTNLIRIIVFAISAFIAGVAGILYGSLVGFASPGDATYGSFASLTLLSALAIAPLAEPWYVLPAAIGTLVPAYLTGGNTTYWVSLVFGVFAVIVSLQGGPPMMPQRVGELITRAFSWRGKNRLAGRRERTEATMAATVTFPMAGHEGSSTRSTRVDIAAGSTLRSEGLEATPLANEPKASRGLSVKHLTVRFGGLTAVSDLTMSAPIGKITGLIGPNGAGKTTTFNACSGLNRPSSGEIVLHGQDVSSKSPSARARRGLGRTFQRMELCDTLTVLENVTLGRESSQAGAHLVRQLVATKSELRLRDEAARSAMEICGIADLATLPAGRLTTGQRRLVELARCLAGSFDLLLLDEPSSGLDRSETEQFGRVLVEVVQKQRRGILLVEHDVGLVMNICDYIYVLDFGELIFEGSPVEVGASPEVKAAYLGDQEIDGPEPLISKEGAGV
jgi:ABC-type branched-subunit amino acid transport system ATPase component/branched-subunit amino acid ABC-type transport system permease component